MYIDAHNGAFAKDDAIFKKLAFLMTLIAVLILPINLINGLYDVASLLLLFTSITWLLYFYYNRTKDFKRASAAVLLVAAVDSINTLRSGALCRRANGQYDSAQFDYQRDQVLTSGRSNFYPCAGQTGWGIAFCTGRGGGHQSGESAETLDPFGAVYHTRHRR